MDSKYYYYYYYCSEHSASRTAVAAYTIVLHLSLSWAVVMASFIVSPSLSFIALVSLVFCRPLYRLPILLNTHHIKITKKNRRGLSPFHKMERGDEPGAPLFQSLGRPILQPLVKYLPIKWDTLFRKSDNRP